MTVHSSDVCTTLGQPVARHLFPFFRFLCVKCDETPQVQLQFRLQLNPNETFFFFNSKIVLSVPLHVTETRSSTQYAHSCVERIRGVLEEGLCSSLCLGSVVSNTDFWQEQRYSHVGLLLYSVTHCFITTCFTCFLNITPQH